MYFRIALLLLALLLNSGVFAAEHAISGPLILKQDQVSLARLEKLDGRQPGEVVSPARWRQAVFELGAAANLPLDWPDSRALAADERRRQDWRHVSLALLHTDYEQDVAGEEQKRGALFAVSPLRERIFHGSNLKLSLQADLILGSAAAGIDRLLLDAGDGQGFRPLELSGDFAVSYATTGNKILTLKAVLTNGQTLQSSTQLDVVALATPDPHETWAIQADQAFDGAFGSGQAYVYLADGHTEVTNPVVVVEGFDIDNSIDWPALYELLNQENMLEDLRAQGYDAVVLDFDEAVDPIQRNAFVLVELIERVIAEITAERSIALIGASMGGLVSRYALLSMEESAINPRVRNFISFDTPHLGANIPMGLQEWVDFFSGLSEEADFLKDRLNSPASRQMLLYHLQSRSGNSAFPDPLQPSLQAEMLGMGDWPVSPRLVSVINGSGEMTDQGFSPGEQILQYEHSDLLVSITGNVWAVPATSDPLTTVFDGYTRIVFFPTSREVQLQNTIAWDNAPGGSRATMQQAADSTAPYGDIIALHNSHSFIPSVSGLALSSTDPLLDIANDPDVLAGSPFDKSYFPVANQEHIEITAENKAWFLYEISLNDPRPDLMFQDGFEAMTEIRLIHELE